MNDISSETGKKYMSREQLRSKALYEAVILFLEQGYHQTTLGQIAQRVGRTKGAVLHVYPDKEAILYDLVTYMFGSQFGNVRKLLGEDADPLLVYGAETALQLHICELSEALRDVYVSAYTLPTTSEYIYQHTAKELHRIFGLYQPDATEQDFYIMEIGSGNVMRGYMTKKCGEKFPMACKLRQFLQTCFKIYEVPREKRETVIQQVLSMDIERMAKDIIAQTVKLAESGFDAELLSVRKNE